MTEIRAFIAIDLPKPIQKQLDEIISCFASEMQENIRWTKANNIHITLKFLGRTPQSKLDTIKSNLTEVCSRHKSFELTIRGLGVFPNVKKPSIIWIGLDQNEAIGKLHKDIDIHMQRLGYKVEERAYKPHLTIGRVNRNTSYQGLQAVSGFISRQAIEQIGVMTVNNVTLYQSDLKPDGPKYTPLHNSHLESN